MINKTAFVAASPTLIRRSMSSICPNQSRQTYRNSNRSDVTPRMTEDPVRKCARCGAPFRQSENTPSSCFYHGDVLGNLMHLNLYEDHHYDDGALDGVKGPRYGRRWACCQDTDPNAPPCKMGYHVTYDCEPARWQEGISFAVK